MDPRPAGVVHEGVYIGSVNLEDEVLLFIQTPRGRGRIYSPDIRDPSFPRVPRERDGVRRSILDDASRAREPGRCT